MKTESKNLPRMKLPLRGEDQCVRDRPARLFLPLPIRQITTSPNHQVRDRGVAAVLAMMFLVIFSSLAAAMAIVSQGNLHTADTSLKINRSLAAAETGMNLMAYRLERAAARVTTRKGVIEGEVASELWLATAHILLSDLSGAYHNIDEPYLEGAALHVGPIELGPGEPTFVATLTPHPLPPSHPGGNYAAARYAQPPYSHLSPAVSPATPLGPEYVRVEVTGYDGTGSHRVSRTLGMDFKIDKKVRYAILSRSRVMIGRNVMVEGPVGSSFAETDLSNGHPVQMESDFRGLNDQLDGYLDALIGSLVTNDANGDNRINIQSPTETEGMDNPEQYDRNGDSYIDDYDLFLITFDIDGNGGVTQSELDSLAKSTINAKQLLELIDTMGDPGRAGFGDGIIDDDDQYAKLRGSIYISAEVEDWNEGAADADGEGGAEGAYQDYLQGPIVAEHRDPPLKFGATDENATHSFDPEDFDTDSFRERATGDLLAQAAAQAANHDENDPGSPSALGEQVTEPVPFGAAHPYDFYDRPVFENMTFTDVRIPKGTNALFKNCRFIGCTFVESAKDNDDPDYNYAGMQESNGAPKHPDRSASVGGEDVVDTKTTSNNLRFDGCTFEGAVVTDSPKQYTHTRNKLAFTGTTRFDVDGSSALSEEEKALYKRSSLLAPHYSVEMGTFVAPFDAKETVRLSGTIVAGLIDMRGQVKLNGTLLTTFEPVSDEGPVIGPTSPQFNTTLGYFSSDAGDLEAEVPPVGLGVIQVRYDGSIPLPDGILGPIEIRALGMSYYEGGGG